MIISVDVSRHTECLDKCIKHSKCVAVNFFSPMTFQENGFCELLSESQLDNPKLMRPFKQASYFENIQCRAGNDVVNEDPGKLFLIITICFTIWSEELSVMLKRISMKKNMH
uniref:Apple domain-containing protein n=1 Tax=Elaeophora elaphi TaxID=1147741 RepID=A0A0R3RNM3_9BILA